jgi:hypothetical protein
MQRPPPAAASSTAAPGGPGPSPLSLAGPRGRTPRPRCCPRRPSRPAPRPTWRPTVGRRCRPGEASTPRSFTPTSSHTGTAGSGEAWPRPPPLALSDSPRRAGRPPRAASARASASPRGRHRQQAGSTTFAGPPPLWARARSLRRCSSVTVRRNGSWGIAQARGSESREAVLLPSRARPLFASAPLTLHPPPPPAAGLSPLAPCHSANATRSRQALPGAGPGRDAGALVLQARPWVRLHHTRRDRRNRLPGEREPRSGRKGTNVSVAHSPAQFQLRSNFSPAHSHAPISTRRLVPPLLSHLSFRSVG